MKIHLLETENFSPKAWEIYNNLSQGDISSGAEPPEDTEILVTRLTPVREELIRSLPGLKAIAYNTTGQDHIDINYAKSVGIKCISLLGHPDFLKDVSATAEHTWGLILALVRNYRSAFNEKDEEKRELYKGIQLKGKTLGIIGYGRVGKQVEKYAEAFGMEIIWCEQTKDWDWVLQISDIVTLHIPLNEETEGAFTAEHFKMMRPTAYFVNTSRSQIVAEGALHSALKEELIAGAASDFPIDASHRVPNIITTPHIAGCTTDSCHKTEEYIADLVAEFVTK